MPLSDILPEYKALLEAGKTLEIIERFYDEEIVQVENYDAPIHGKRILLQMEIENIERVHSFEIKLTDLITDEAMGKVMGEMEVRFESRKSGKKILEEAFVQHWKQDRIIYQRFYYKGFSE
jgi:hypothetical protein